MNNIETKIKETLKQIDATSSDKRKRDLRRCLRNLYKKRNQINKEG